MVFTIPVKILPTTRACALQYQDFIHILISDLMQCNIKKQQAKRAGVLETVASSGPTDEEQGRGTLHGHWKIWIKEFNQPLRDALFARDYQV